MRCEGTCGRLGQCVLDDGHDGAHMPRGASMTFADEDVPPRCEARRNGRDDQRCVMSAGHADLHRVDAHEWGDEADEGHPLRVLLGDRVFVLIALVRSGIEALHSIDPDVDGGLFHSIGGPTGCTLTVGGHEYRVTIEGPV